MAEGPCKSRSPKYNFQSLLNALTWSNGFCGERGKRGGMVGKGNGPWQRNAVIIPFCGLFKQLFPLGKADTSQHLYHVVNLEKQVRPLCA
jgi:hypothetical protein